VTNPELAYEAIWITRRNKCPWKVVIVMALILLIQMATVSRANTPPTSRVDFDTAQGINWIIVESIWRSPGNVHRRTHFTD
jgi:hypothetical protein